MPVVAVRVSVGVGTSAGVATSVGAAVGAGVGFGAGIGGDVGVGVTTFLQAHGEKKADQTARAAAPELQAEPAAKPRRALG